MCRKNLETRLLLDVYSRENDFFFKFETKSESGRILHGGTWLFDGRLIILKRWTESTNLERDLLLSIPVWVRFPSLHLKFWSKRVLSKVASLIGKLLYSDNATASGDRIAYARCFIEIAAAKSLPEHVSLELEGRERIKLLVEYEWMPPLCMNCAFFGHIDGLWPTIKGWRPNVQEPKNQEHELERRDGNINRVVTDKEDCFAEDIAEGGHTCCTRGNNQWGITNRDRCSGEVHDQE